MPNLVALGQMVKAHVLTTTQDLGQTCPVFRGHWRSSKMTRLYIGVYDFLLVIHSNIGLVSFPKYTVIYRKRKFSYLEYTVPICWGFYHRKLSTLFGLHKRWMMSWEKQFDDECNHFGTNPGREDVQRDGRKKTINRQCKICWRAIKCKQEN